jgi:hypothetical protein
VQQPALLPPTAINRRIPAQKARPQALRLRIAAVPNTRARKEQRPVQP